MQTTGCDEAGAKTLAERPVVKVAAPRLTPTVAALSAAGSTLAACGGGGSSETPPPPAPPPVAALTTPEASRLLAQASFGAHRTEVDRVRSLGAAAWLDEQLAAPRGQGHVDWLRAQGFETSTFVNARAPIDYSIWRKFLSSSDQLRQRMICDSA